jgi:hypothetical protein
MNPGRERGLINMRLDRTAPEGEYPMATTVVRYQAKPDRADENQRLIEAVFAELDARQPEGFTYQVFRLEDGVSFVHVASVDTDDGTNPLTTTPAFSEFVREIADRCEEGPVASGATAVGSYESAS